MTRLRKTFGYAEPPADFKSAIQPVGNLRSKRSRSLALGSPAPFFSKAAVFGNKL